ncbi:unnamed protein product, partial [Rangifer tarandus platyrhynchus]
AASGAGLETLDGSPRALGTLLRARSSGRGEGPRRGSGAPRTWSAPVPGSFATEAGSLFLQLSVSRWRPESCPGQAAPRAPRGRPRRPLRLIPAVRLCSDSQVGMFQVGRASIPKPAARSLEALDSVQRVLLHRASSQPQDRTCVSYVSCIS